MAESIRDELIPVRATLSKVINYKLFAKRNSGSYDLLPSSNTGHTSSQVFIKMEEVRHLIPPNKPMSVAAAAMTSNDLPADIAYADTTSEQQEFITQNNDDKKEAVGDTLVKNDPEDYLENKESLNKTPDAINDKQGGDKVDGEMLTKPFPPDKVWKSNASIIEDEDFDTKCLYYTIQCCDCVII